MQQSIAISERTVALRREEIFRILTEERALQDGLAEALSWKKDKSVGEYLLVIEHELNEAKRGWIKDASGRDHPLHELVQIAAVCLACLEAYSMETLRWLSSQSSPAVMEAKIRERGIDPGEITNAKAQP